MASETSTIEWIGILVFALPVAVLLLGFIFALLNGFNDAIQDSDAVGQVQKDRLDSQVDQQQSLWDYAFLTFFVGVVIVIFLLARSTVISPFWWFLLFVLLIFVVLAAGFMSNFFAEFAAEETLALAERLPIMHHIVTNWLWYILAIGFGSLALSRTRPGGDL